MRLLGTITTVRRRPFVALCVGIVLEAAFVGLIGADDEIKGIRGIGGETAALLAVIGAVFAGPWVGAAMAAVGWGVFFPTIANSRPSSIVALAEWTVAAYLVGLLSASLVEATRARDAAERQREAAHALRAPVATIHGLVTTICKRGRTDATDATILRSIADETERLLSSPLFRDG
ncbi:MAG TPA: hypothetical protein VFA30_05570 [Gaiellaceae bacterium]|nr:hypothetical protein [Gaiellaceae bacterium]